jgi:hypothetical protein
MLELKADRAENADYEHDLVLWHQRQIELLRERRFEQLDVDHLIEELESAVGNDRRELAHRLEVLLMHLLKCQFQHERLCGSWKGTLTEQRSAIGRLLEESPSLGATLMPAAAKCYPAALRRAADETGIARSVFPSTNPYSRDQILDLDFVP